MKTHPSQARIPSLAAQQARANLAFASRRYVHLLSDDERAAWRDYAATQTVIDPKTKLARPAQGNTLFVGLTSRYQRVNPAEPNFPHLPPRFPFAGDKIIVTAETVSGGVVFMASGPTSADVRVELLLQRLASPARSPHPARYRTQAYASFADAGSAVFVPALSGWYIPAYCFVSTETGQDTPLVVLPKVTLG